MLSDTEIEALADRAFWGPGKDREPLTDDEIQALGDACIDLLTSVRGSRRGFTNAVELTKQQDAEIAALKARVAELEAQQRLDNAFEGAMRCAEILAAELGHDDDIATDDTAYAEPATHGPCDGCEAFADLDENNFCTVCGEKFDRRRAELMAGAS
jgi:hypothetical protein